MVTPLAVPITPAEMPWETTAFRKWAETGGRTALATAPQTQEQDPGSLDEESIDVGRPVGQQLVSGNGHSYEQHITTRESQCPTSLRAVDKGGEDLPGDRQCSIPSKRGGSDSGVEADHSDNILSPAVRCASAGVLLVDRREEVLTW